jgi:dTDP-glucose 4,6-dehydratase
MMKTILVTGGAGFIGSNFVRHILRERPDWQVRVLDKLTYAGRLENLADVWDVERLRFIKGDICDATIVSEAIGCCEQVFNFAAESHVDRSLMAGEEGAGAFVQTDVFGVYVLLEAAKKYGVQKFVQVSTDEVYGDIESGHSVESDPLAPRSPYSAAKAGGELLAHSYFTSHDVPVITTRGSNTFGPYQFPEKLIPLFVTSAIDGKPLPLYGDGLQRRDWLFVEDHCAGILLASEKGKAGESYNLGGGNERTNHEITNMILELTGKPKSLIKNVADRPGHDRRYALDCAKLRALGWHPHHNFEDAMRQTVQWYQNREDWWRPIIADDSYQEYSRTNYDKR